MRQQIVIPWRDAGCIYRRRHFNFLCDYYSQEFDIIIANNKGDFNRSASRNLGVEQTKSIVSVVIDADNYIPYDQIYAAIEKAHKVGKLVKPFNYFGYLTEESTDLFYDIHDIPEIDFDPSYIDPPQKDFTGGAYVMKTDIWKKLGGMDEGFVGWGAEDDAFHIICKKRLGRIHCTHGYDYHLYHPAHRVTSDYNYSKLMKDYVKNKKL